mmetsp:Transcript_29019/g.26383  ORF Transcript_29019/g.26383 Transcript_29019/m.26383 type:complete len:315 (+) Transcript_29019:379-1323(+)|eukprot:CAMPEP_0114577108 /NCGR_PEP_ID=MMETSP0125-20121206/1807_1 /TAXON_ID=485358 ORGANISM="Aristerostoma sp., Strain ATCC 50986" /NCGR_SAMPLE_ID=MMETSP0125 /ASSEMBLY_ACC=CAM_ASM_000245 /LENGTH=314 /DNA_ID=CAMNT_0001766167 /DNA_START=594 /DNA_END=1538 /DNA_ORIENTATION=+
MKEMEGTIRLKETLDGKEMSKGCKLVVTYVNNNLNAQEDTKQQGPSSPYQPNKEFIPSYPELYYFNDKKTHSENGSMDNSPLLTMDEKPKKFHSSYQMNKGEDLMDNMMMSNPKYGDDLTNKTVMVRNLPMGTTADELFRLFGMYGNVMRVKIFFKSPENALVEFQENEQATLAKNLLDGCPFRQRILYINISKTAITSNGNENRMYYREYYKQKGHRYRKIGSKNFKNIAPPSRVIHVSNLIPEKESSYYLNLFSKCGKILNWMLLTGECETLLIEFENLQQSVEALAVFHNYQESKTYLKVSFSKYDTIRQI